MNSNKLATEIFERICQRQGYTLENPHACIAEIEQGLVGAYDSGFDDGRKEGYDIGYSNGYYDGNDTV